MNKKLFSIQNISKLDDNTIMLESYLQDRKKYYVNTENFTLHNDIPTNSDNKITLMSEYLWVIKSISQYIIAEENKIVDHKSLLTNILSKYQTLKSTSIYLQVYRICLKQRPKI